MTMVLTLFLLFLLPPVAFQIITDNGKYHRNPSRVFDCCLSHSNLFFLPFFVIVHWIFRDRLFLACFDVLPSPPGASLFLSMPYRQCKYCLLSFRLIVGSLSITFSPGLFLFNSIHSRLFSQSLPLRPIPSLDPSLLPRIPLYSLLPPYLSHPAPHPILFPLPPDLS
jgi:hypothetical protein